MLLEGLRFAAHSHDFVVFISKSHSFVEFCERPWNEISRMLKTLVNVHVTTKKIAVTETFVNMAGTLVWFTPQEHFRDSTGRLINAEKVKIIMLKTASVML